MSPSRECHIGDKFEFLSATIQSKAKLVYDQVSDWLENTGDWQPESEAIAEQARLQAQICPRCGGRRPHPPRGIKHRPATLSYPGVKGIAGELPRDPRPYTPQPSKK
ncbi:exoribonuclease II, partial [Escherichia coli]|nr:exoribonuclease II [Escherichia coli]